MSEIFSAWLVAGDTVLAVAHPDCADLENASDFVQEDLARCGVALIDSESTVGDEDVAHNFECAMRDYEATREEIQWGCTVGDASECFEADIQALEDAVEALTNYAMWQGLTDRRYYSFNYVVDLEKYRACTGDASIFRSNVEVKLGEWLDEAAKLYVGDFSVVRWCSVEDLQETWGEDWRDNLAEAIDLVDDCERIEYTGWISDPVEFLNRVGANFGKRVTVEELSV